MSQLIKSKYVDYTKTLGLKLEVRKYARKVFYNNLWDTDENLIKSRGSVFINGEQMVFPMDKCFNYGENGAGLDIGKDTHVLLYKKLNGFMINLTLLAATQGLYILSTTGSACIVKNVSGGKFEILQDDGGVVEGNKFLHYALQLLNDYEGFWKYRMYNANGFGNHITLTFEGCHPEDEHIVKEDVGLHPLCMQFKHDNEVKHTQCTNTGLFVACLPLSSALHQLRAVNHEGFMVYSSCGKELLFKLKSPYYLAKKWVQRDFKSRVWSSDYKSRVEEEYYPIIEYIRKNFTKDSWKELDERTKADVFLTAYNETSGV